MTGVQTCALPISVAVREEVLELRPIQTIRKELEAMAPIERVAQVAAASIVFPVAPPPPQKTETADIIIEKVEKEIVVEIKKPEALAFETWLNQFNLPPIASRVSPKQPTEQPPVPWEEPEDLAAEPEDKVAEKTPGKTPNPGIAQQLAAKSVSEKEEVRSESLAKILVLQGYKEKAILMYQRLMLDFPEKSTIFAAAIEELKK